jgi:hypothetical protein
LIEKLIPTLLKSFEFSKYQNLIIKLIRVYLLIEEPNQKLLPKMNMFFNLELHKMARIDCTHYALFTQEINDIKLENKSIEEANLIIDSFSIINLLADLVRTQCNSNLDSQESQTLPEESDDTEINHKRSKQGSQKRKRQKKSKTLLDLFNTPESTLIAIQSLVLLIKRYPAAHKKVSSLYLEHILDAIGSHDIDVQEYSRLLLSMILELCPSLIEPAPETAREIVTESTKSTKGDTTESGNDEKINLIKVWDIINTSPKPQVLSIKLLTMLLKSGTIDLERIEILCFKIRDSLGFEIFLSECKNIWVDLSVILKDFDFSVGPDKINNKNIDQCFSVMLCLLQNDSIEPLLESYILCENEVFEYMFVRFEKRRNLTSGFNGTQLVSLLFPTKRKSPSEDNRCVDLVFDFIKSMITKYQGLKTQFNFKFVILITKILQTNKNLHSKFMNSAGCLDAKLLAIYRNASLDSEKDFIDLNLSNFNPQNFMKPLSIKISEIFDITSSDKFIPKKTKTEKPDLFSFKHSKRSFSPQEKFSLNQRTRLCSIFYKNHLILDYVFEIIEDSQELSQLFPNLWFDTGIFF